MSSVHNDPPGPPKPGMQDLTRAKKKKAIAPAAGAAASPAQAGDHIHTPSKAPLLAGSDTFDASPATKAKGAKQILKEQVMGHGGIKGLLMFKPVAAMLRVAGLSFIQDAFEQVRANEPPLGFKATANRMLMGAALGGLTMLLTSSVPLGIAGAATAAAGPAAVPFFAAIAAFTLYGAIAGAYQAYKTTRPRQDPTMQVKLDHDGTPQTTVTLDHDDSPHTTVRLDRISENKRLKPVSLPPPATSVSATSSTPVRDASSDAGSATVDAAAAVDNAATAEDAKTDKEKAAFTQGLPKVSNRDNVEDR